MTNERAKADLDRLVADNGFTEAGKTTDTNNTIYRREWAREVEVVGYGKQQATMEIRVRLCGTAVLVTVLRNGHRDTNFIRDYSSPKRAMNAAKEIATFAVFEW